MVFDFKRHSSTVSSTRWPALRLIICLGLFAAVFGAEAVWAQQSPPNGAVVVSLKSFLQSYLGDPLPDQDDKVQYSPAFVDFQDDGRLEVIVYVNGPSWCGSGGCNMLILAPEAATYKIVSQTAITRPPIRVLNRKSRGWHDIAVIVQGGGIMEAYEAVLQLDGVIYPSSPTVTPAHRLKRAAKGRVVITTADANARSLDH